MRFLFREDRGEQPGGKNTPTTSCCGARKIFRYPFSSPGWVTRKQNINIQKRPRNNSFLWVTHQSLQSEWCTFTCQVHDTRNGCTIIRLQERSEKKRRRMFTPAFISRRFYSCISLLMRKQHFYFTSGDGVNVSLLAAVCNYQPDLHKRSSGLFPWRGIWGHPHPRSQLDQRGTI